ncbi:hypothetical protein B0H14DRAFT_2641633 [Mycena olivaceomarginata]|nr:hypothetical protein B0H14DRAFT_2641633 [Mycena olivaceomarginata]
MPTTLPRTNMTAEDMVPDHENPSHDPQYWCLPAVHDTPIKGRTNGYAMYLVSQGRRVGVWHNWTVVKAMVDGFPGAAQRGHDTMEATNVRPVRTKGPPTTPSRGTPKSTPHVLTNARCTGLPNLEALSLGPMQREGEPSSPSSPSSLTAMTWDAVPTVARYFALWGGRIVFTDCAEAKAAFLEAEVTGTPRILSTSDYDEAQAFSESCCAIPRILLTSDYDEGQAFSELSYFSDGMKRCSWIAHATPGVVVIAVGLIMGVVRMKCFQERRLFRHGLD